MNKFDKNLKFTVDTLEDGLVHFLDLDISGAGIDIFRKNTNTGQYTQFSSFESWGRKTAWVKAVFARVHIICTNTNLSKKQISKIISFMLWNGFHARTRKALINRLKGKHDSNTSIKFSKENPDDSRPNIWLKLLYLGTKGEQLVKWYIKKVRRHLEIRVNFIAIYDTTKITYFTSKKEKFWNFAQQPRL